MKNRFLFFSIPLIIISLIFVMYANIKHSNKSENEELPENIVLFENGVLGVSTENILFESAVMELSEDDEKKIYLGDNPRSSRLLIRNNANNMDAVVFSLVGDYDGITEGIGMSTLVQPGYFWKSIIIAGGYKNLTASVRAANSVDTYEIDYSIIEIE